MSQLGNTFRISKLVEIIISSYTTISEFAKMHLRKQFELQVLSFALISAEKVDGLCLLF